MSDALTLERPATAATSAAWPARPLAARGAEIPIGLLAEITHRCPLQCPYCSNPWRWRSRPASCGTATGRASSTRRPRSASLQVHLSGGEPLARRDVDDDRARRPRGRPLHQPDHRRREPDRTSVPTRCVEAGVEHVQISLQDATEAGCNRITNYRKASRRSSHVARARLERGLPLTINAVVHRQNLDRVEEMIELAPELGAHRLEVANTQYYGWALAQPRRADAEPRAGGGGDGDRRARRASGCKGRLLIDYVVPDYYAASIPSPAWAAGAGSIIVVTPSGQVLPCHAAQIDPGPSLRQRARPEPRAGSGGSSEAFNRFRGTDWMPEPCRSCDRRQEDFGGCRCQAFMLTGERRGDRPGLPSLAASCSA